MKNLRFEEPFGIRCENTKHFNTVERIQEGYISYGDGISPRKISKDAIDNFLKKKVEAYTYYFINDNNEIASLVSDDSPHVIPEGESISKLQVDRIKKKEEAISLLEDDHKLGELSSTTAERINANPCIKTVLDWLEEIGIQARNPETEKRWGEPI